MVRRRPTAKEHRERERAAAAEIGRARAAFDQAVRAGWCFAAEFDPGGCSDKIIKAHAVQRGGVLERIADGGHDFHGRQIQDLDDDSVPVTGTACFVLPTDTGGIVGLAWLERTPAAYMMFRSASRLDLATAPHDILRFALTHSEDCYFAPRFWRDLASVHQDWVRTRLSIGTAERPPTALDLLDDRVRLVEWRATERFVVEPRAAAP